MSPRACVRSCSILFLVAALVPAAAPIAVAQQESSQRTPVAPPNAAQAQLTEVRAKLAELRVKMEALQAQLRELGEQRNALMRQERELSKTQAAAEGASREEVERIANRGVPARELARGWVESAMQIEDAEKRAAALESIRVALRTGDPDASHAALLALPQLAKLEFDKASFRESVLPYVDARDPELRVAAFYALYNTRVEAQDIERVLAFAKDAPKQQQGSALHLLFMYSQGDLTGRAGDAALALLATDDGRELHQILPGLWGARVSPALAKRLIELSHSADSDVRHNAIYFGLSTFKDKSPEVVDELIAVLSDPDWNNSGRALWGLEQGVLAESEPKVVAAMLRFLKARSDPRERESALRIIGKYGTRADVPELEALAQNPLADEGLRQAARKTIETLRAK